MPFVLILQVPLAQIGKQLSLIGPKKHLLPHFFFITVRSCVPGACLAHPALDSFLLCVLDMYYIICLYFKWIDCLMGMVLLGALPLRPRMIGALLGALPLRPRFLGALPLRPRILKVRPLITTSPQIILSLILTTISSAANPATRILSWVRVTTWMGIV